MIGSRNVRAGLVLLAVGLLGGLALSLYAFHPVVQPPAGLANYDDLPRRLLRLAHVAAVMLPLINIVVGPWIDRLDLSPAGKQWSSTLLIGGAAGLPLALGMEAVVPALRPLHPSGLPAVGFIAGAVLMAVGAVRGLPPAAAEETAVSRRRKVQAEA
ncbi:MAG TPA: hypothetical protein VEJ18_21330 [Planctomycetota bacterium]|nr:hypothetical protein [Planctomycetota bacterium]